MAQADYQFLWDALEEHDRLLGRAGGSGVLHATYTTGNAAVRRWNARLSDALTDALNPLPQAAQFWRDHAPVAEGERLMAMHLLLRLVDDAFRAVVPRRIAVRDGLIVIGRAFWLRQAEAHARRRNRPAHVAGGGHPFRHLRRVRAPAGAWIEVPDEAFAPIVRGGELRVALCGLGAGAPMFRPTSVTEEAIQRFAAAALEPVAETDPVQQLREAVSWAIGNGAHVLCLPELCVPPDGVAAIRDELTRHGGDGGDGGAGSLCLVVAGTFHAPAGEAPANVAPVWFAVGGVGVGGGGDAWEELSYRKFDPVRLSLQTGRELPQLAAVVEAAAACGCGSLEEDLVPGDAALLLNTPCGTFGILICRDYISVEAPVHLATAAAADHILIPSMNFNPTAEFEGRMQFLARERYTASFYLNSAWAAERSPANAAVAYSVLPLSVGGGNGDLRSIAFRRPGTPPLPPAHRLDQHELDPSYNLLLRLPLLEA